MGPYCNFCNQRCFVPIPADAPQEARDAYGQNTICATCAGGQKLEKDTVGWCYDDMSNGAETTEKTDERYLIFLDQMRESGSVNMLGAAQPLREMFPELSPARSREILRHWMETFTQRHPQTT